MASYGGRLPADARALRRMRGIGRYTAGAILSFAYRQDAALVDTNVRRVLGRIFLGPRRLRRLRVTARSGNWPRRCCRPGAPTTTIRR